jgi:hypothetical protein
MDKNIGVAVDQVYTKVREWEGEDMKEMKREKGARAVRAW